MNIDRLVIDLIWLRVCLLYSKTCLKRNAFVPVFFSVFTGFRFTKGCVLIKQSTKDIIVIITLRRLNGRGIWQERVNEVFTYVGEKP